MLEAGWPVDAPGIMGAKDPAIPSGPGTEIPGTRGTAPGWSRYGSGKGWLRDSGDFAGTVRGLLEAAAVVPPGPEDLEPGEAVLEVLRQFRRG